MSEHNLIPLSIKTEDLQKHGFTTEFIFYNNQLHSEGGHHFSHVDLTILNYYRFEGETDPADESILYALETNTGERGVVVNGYGPEANMELNDFLKLVKTKA